MHAIRTFTIFVVVLFAVALSGDEPQQPVHFFQLTDEGLAKYETATANLEKVAATLRETEPPAPEKDDGSADAFLNGFINACEKVAPFKRAVEDATLTCRDFAVTNIALMQASILSLGYKKDGVAFLEGFPGGARGHVRANVEFAMKRAERIAALAAKQERIFSPR